MSYYIYAYLREDGSPYYIGKGKGRRAWHNHNACNAKPPKDKTRIIIMESNLTEVGSLALERFYIRWYGKICDNTGVLRNKSDGGEGGVINSGCRRKWQSPVCKGMKMPILSKKKKEYWEKWRKENPDYRKKWKTYEKVGYSIEAREKRAEGARIRNKININCPHCGKSGQLANMIRWHFDNCKEYDDSSSIEKCK
jgi:hypothetical protein